MLSCFLISVDRRNRRRIAERSLWYQGNTLDTFLRRSLTRFWGVRCVWRRIPCKLLVGAAFVAREAAGTPEHNSGDIFADVVIRRSGEGADISVEDHFAVF